MDNQQFLDAAFKNLPGGLILVDLRGRLRVMNETAEMLLGLRGKFTPGDHCKTTLDAHPKIIKVLLATCTSQTGSSRQELVTQRPDGEDMVVGYSTVVMKNAEGEAFGIAMTFQDITRLIPLMDSEQFLNIALKNMPGGLIFVDVQGRVRGVNEMAKRILGLKKDVEPGEACHKALGDHPQVYKVLLSTCENLMAVNRHEITTRKSNGEKVTLGYGTLILKNAQGKPIGVGMTFQDITRYIPLPLKAEFIRIVDRFFTPFALALVVSALFLGFAEPQVKWTAIGLVVCLGLFNEISAYLARKKTEWTVTVGNTRLLTNFVANIALVYMLGTFWGPMWLLFVLTPVATALYASQSRTLITALISSAALLGIYWSRGLEGPVGWGQAALHATFILFISMFVNSIARLVMQMKNSQGMAPKQQTRMVFAGDPPKVNASSEAVSDRKLAA
jgi:PAS domain S-box-containing protein